MNIEQIIRSKQIHIQIYAQEPDYTIHYYLFFLKAYQKEHVTDTRFHHDRNLAVHKQKSCA